MTQPVTHPTVLAARAATLDADGLPVPDPTFEQRQKASLMAFFAGETDTEPVLHGTDPGLWRDLSARIPGLLVTAAGGMVPFQAEGTIHGLPFYFRYRGGWASLKVSSPDSDESTLEPLYSAGMEYGDEYAGVLNRDEFITLMTTLVPQLERAPFLWEFEGKDVKVENLADKDQPVDLRFTTTDITEVYRAWGHTPVEAYDTLHETSQWLVDRGWTEQAQRENHRARAINPTPLNTDNRVFPDPEPTFEAKP